MKCNKIKGKKEGRSEFYFKFALSILCPVASVRYIFPIDLSPISFIYWTPDTDNRTLNHYFPHQ